ncbi:uncharacterized protein C8Q71DRAFT_864778, partial [Rhodofomes roseus]
ATATSGAPSSASYSLPHPPSPTTASTPPPPSPALTAASSSTRTASMWSSTLGPTRLAFSSTRPAASAAPGVRPSALRRPQHRHACHRHAIPPRPLHILPRYLLLPQQHPHPHRHCRHPHQLHQSIRALLPVSPRANQVFRAPKMLITLVLHGNLFGELD